MEACAAVRRPPADAPARSRWRFAVLAILLPAISVPAAEIPTPAATASPRPPADGPSIRFVALAHDFGSIKRGAQATHTFVFSNTGKAMLEFNDVQVTQGARKRLAPAIQGRSAFVGQTPTP